jgi:hypothetical protein
LPKWSLSDHDDPLQTGELSRRNTNVEDEKSRDREVRVKTGVTLPDLPDIPLGNWAGTISNIFVNQTPVTYEIKWNRRTLDGMPSIYRKRCERDGYKWDSVW